PHPAELSTLSLHDALPILAHLSVLQTEAQVAITTIGQQQTQVQTNLSGLTNNFTVLQTALETVQNSQTTIASNVADQQSQLDSRSEEHTSELQSLAYLVCR